MKIIFSIFSSIFTCDGPMVPITTLVSFKTGADVVPGSTWGDLQTHTKTTMRCGFGCLVEMCENRDCHNTCLCENQWWVTKRNLLSNRPPRFFLKIHSDVIWGICKCYWKNKILGEGFEKKHALSTFLADFLWKTLGGDFSPKIAKNAKKCSFFEVLIGF